MSNFFTIIIKGFLSHNLFEFFTYFIPVSLLEIDLFTQMLLFVSQMDSCSILNQLATTSKPLAGEVNNIEVGWSAWRFAGELYASP